MKYLEYMHDGVIPMKRIESDYIPILRGHLVIKEGNSMSVSGEITQKSDNFRTGRSLALTKEQLLELRKCIDKALENFDSFQAKKAEDITIDNTEPNK